MTVIGILRLRFWARYSILFIGSGLAAFDASAAFVTPTTLPARQTHQPAVDPASCPSPTTGPAALYLITGGIRVWWIILVHHQRASSPRRLPEPGTTAQTMLEA